MNKKVILSCIATLVTTIIIIIISCTLNLSGQMSDSQLKDYYEQLYGDKDVVNDLTDEQLKEYYENLYGDSNNGLEEEDNYSSSSDTVYTFDTEDNTYIEYLSLNYNKAYKIQDSSSKITYLHDHQGDLVSLVTDNGETKFNNGVAIAGAAACYTYTDVRQQGYEMFSGYFGAHYLARYTNSSSTSFNIQFLCDGVTVHKTVSFTKDTVAEYVEIDLTDVDVFQIIIDIQGSGNGDYIGMGDPKFTKEKATPYLDAFDLEFNLPSQVTAFNILEFVEAYDITGKNITDTVTYETSYIQGQTGSFDVTYIVKHNVNGEEITRRDTVIMDVYNIDYSDVWTVEDFKQPYVNHLYYARQTYSPQMRKLFDFLIEDILDFDDSEWTKKYRSNIYTSQNAKRYNFKEAGIYLTYSEINKILSGICDSDTRTFMILDLDLMGSYYSTTDSVTGLTSYCWFWAQNLTTEQYDSRIQQILTNSETVLSYAKDDMTFGIKWKYVADAFQSRITYTDGGSLYNSVGLFKGKCNGNSRGLVYLAQRLSIRSIYANGMSTAGFHAWTYQQLPDNNTWYMTDRLWGSVLAKDGNHGHVVYTNNGYTFPTISKSSYSTSNYTYPVIWMTFSNNSFTINQGQSINIAGNVNGVDGLFSDIIVNNTITYVIKDLAGNVVNSDTSKLSNGQYKIYYQLNYTSYLYNINRTQEVSLTIN